MNEINDDDDDDDDSSLVAGQPTSSAVQSTAADQQAVTCEVPTVDNSSQPVSATDASASSHGTFS